MRVFLLKPVTKWLKKTKTVNDADMIQAAKEVEKGLVEANLGGNVYKKRIASTSGRGQSSGSRLLIAFQEGNNLFFMSAFNKNNAGNISSTELAALRMYAKKWLEATEENLNKALKAEIINELNED